MTGFRGSASRTDAGDPRVLLCGVNWVGDTIMSMPAVQAFRTAHPDARIELLVKPGMAALWEMHPVPDVLHRLAPGGHGVRRAARALRAEGFDRAYVLPHSFRSALPPFLAGIPERYGLAGGLRDVMLNRVVRPDVGPGRTRTHQAWEYIDLLVPEQDVQTLEYPTLQVPEASAEAVRRQAPEGDGPLIGLLPGAARGPSKQWPLEHFKTLARTLCAERQARLALLGNEGDRALCTSVAQDLPGAVNLAGRTGFGEWAAWLQGCDAVVTNDSGGMHLAAALGTPVAAIYGITDPEATGPLGERVRLLQKSTRRTRDIPRDCPEARSALEAVLPAEVGAAVDALLAG